MKAEIWEVPVEASWSRANDLVELKRTSGQLKLSIAEEETEQLWALTFESVQGVRVTTEECAGGILETLPDKGGFFQMSDSDWLRALGKGSVPFLENARHYVICCYDEVVEVIGTEPRFESENGRAI